MSSRQRFQERHALLGAVALAMLVSTVVFAGCGDAEVTFRTRPPVGPIASSVHVAVPVGSAATASAASRATAATGMPERPGRGWKPRGPRRRCRQEMPHGLTPAPKCRKLCLD